MNKKITHAQVKQRVAVELARRAKAPDSEFVDADALKPTFERTADATLATTRATYSQRGGEYGDSWSLENMVATFTEHTLKAIGNDRSPAAIRLLVMAALVDVKDSRMTGPFKADSIIDGVAYRASYCQMRLEYEAEQLAR
jgi:hypothetical protein